MARHKKVRFRPISPSNVRRHMKIDVTISRQSSTAGEYTDPYAFMACVRMKGAGDCGYGKNPRKALANAMLAVGKKLKTRKGAFSGRR